jgi:TonB family protein
VQSAARKNESAPAVAAGRGPAAAVKKAKLSVYLVTRDDMLWPQIGVHIGNQLILKQVDSVDELLSATTSGQPAIILWDARNQSGAAAVLPRLHAHSPRFAVVALDAAGNTKEWTSPIAQRLVIAHLAVPISVEQLSAALDNAQEEVGARKALLGEDDAAAPARLRKTPWITAAIAAGVLLAAAAAYLLTANREPVAKTAPPASLKAAPAAPAKAPQAADEKVDLLIEKAQQAMLDRHFIDPAEGSALSLYRSALLLDPDNGEARQGLQRLAEILFARVQSALDERKFDVALQALETARSISPGDARLGALDERIASLRAEVGPAQILAAINAQSFDRAQQLIDEAARAKTLSSAKLGQLRDELRRRHEESDLANAVKLIDTRLQQDRATEPREDSAVYYLNQARAAGASSAALQPQYQEIYKHLSQSLRPAVEQRRFADADRSLADWQSAGVPSSMIAGLQRDLNAARNQQTAASAAAENRQYQDLAQSRLAQGKVLEPDNDSALFYLNQLRAADPKNATLPQLTSAVQTQVLLGARAALDANQLDRAEPLLQTAASLGTSTELTALNQRLADMKSAASGPPQVAEASLTRSKPIDLQYPEEARRNAIEGWVELSFGVTTEGKVINVKVTNSSPAGVFDQAAVRAESRVRYQPPMQGGKPIAVVSKLRLAFHLAK